MSKIFDLLWKKSENEGKAQWERVGVMLVKDDGKKSMKFDVMPVGQWDGWLVVSERKAKEKVKEAF
ncbi:MAG TPA: hypothetical protein ENH45_02065 [Nitrospirae bacterium]|nr:hypothetical protein BMS3Bbin09_00249 [bacterium BMS3Bbin09]HDN95094.1 hypothetical protein [Nitrospirota bacterium]HDZ83978.1 hypothetical protein [Nitrospirota bacterium]